MNKSNLIRDIKRLIFNLKIYILLVDFKIQNCFYQPKMNNNYLNYMDRMKNIENKLVQKNFTENFLKLMPTFYEMESSFLSGVYKRYGDLEGGNIVIFFARDCHLEILRKREKDLKF